MMANTLEMQYAMSHPNQYPSSIIYEKDKELKNTSSFPLKNANTNPVVSTLLGLGATFAFSFFSQIPVFHNEFSKSLENTLYSNERIINSLSENITPFEIIENDSVNFIKSQIDRISLYESGWNGERSIGASTLTVNDAKKFCEILFATDVRIPKVSLADDGEINFYWSFDKNILDLGFFGDGNYSYYFKGKDGKELFADDMPINEILNDKIIELIRT